MTMQTEQYPSKILENAVSELSKLPGVGRRTALRYALSLLSKDKKVSHDLADSIIALRDDIKHCRMCHNISDNDLCDICSNPLRRHDQICVVESVRGVLSIEATGEYHGLYHVLGGVISPMDGIGPNDLTLKALSQRVHEGGIEEVILALNPTMEGDTTNFYIQRLLADTDVKLSVLARGVSIGDDLEYADEITLGKSLINRTALK